MRLVRQLRKETGERHGAVQRVARQLGFGVETVRKWVNQADIDAGERPGTTSEDNAGSAGSSRRTGSCAGPTRSCGRRRLSSRRSSTAHNGDRRVHRRSTVTSSGSSRSARELQIAPSTYYAAKTRAARRRERCETR